MKKLIVLFTVITLSGCVEMKQRWDNLEPAEKVAVAVVVAATGTALIVRNGQSSFQQQQQCISVKSLETGCIR